MVLTEFQNTPLNQLLSLTKKLGINETITLNDRNINTIKREINSTAKRLLNFLALGFLSRKLMLFPSKPLYSGL
jgi:hypothetical protein